MARSRSSLTLGSLRSIQHWLERAMVTRLFWYPLMPLASRSHRRQRSSRHMCWGICTSTMLLCQLPVGWVNRVPRSGMCWQLWPSFAFRLRVLLSDLWRERLKRRSATLVSANSSGGRSLASGLSPPCWLIRGLTLNLPGFSPIRQR